VKKKATTKGRSLEQEDFIAKQYGGKRSPSSGGAATDRGDVRARNQLIECKYIGFRNDAPAKSFSIKVEDLEKIADEAWHEGREPVMAIRIRHPDSPLANHTGYIDITIRLTRDDVYRNDIIESQQSERAYREGGGI
jgi:hypothetical protein